MDALSARELGIRVLDGRGGRPTLGDGVLIERYDEDGQASNWLGHVAIEASEGFGSGLMQPDKRLLTLSEGTPPG
ncbi:MAG: hypothetical protein VW362_11360, partial [Candidatus Nanopelagicales bacterium]